MVVRKSAVKTVLSCIYPEISSPKGVYPKNSKKFSLSSRERTRVRNPRAGGSLLLVWRKRAFPWQMMGSGENGSEKRLISGANEKQISRLYSKEGVSEVLRNAGCQFSAVFYLHRMAGILIWQ